MWTFETSSTSSPSVFTSTSTFSKSSAPRSTSRKSRGQSSSRLPTTSSTTTSRRSSSSSTTTRSTIRSESKCHLCRLSFYRYIFGKIFLTCCLSIKRALNISIVHNNYKWIVYNCILLEGQIVINFKWSILTDLLLLVRGTNIHQLESHSSRIIFWHYNGFSLWILFV